jgi:hypothetical protein
MQFNDAYAPAWKELLSHSPHLRQLDFIWIRSDDLDSLAPLTSVFPGSLSRTASPSGSVTFGLSKRMTRWRQDRSFPQK